MTRREFLHRCGVATALLTLPRWSWAADLPKDEKITRIVAFNLVSKRPKMVGKNSRLDVHGDSATDRTIRIYTASGLQSVGWCRANEETLRSLLGKNPFDFFQADPPVMKSPLGAGTMALWDLAGKALKKPVWQLLGAKGSKRVRTYDGSIYFADLLPQYENKWEDRFKQEIDEGLASGHVAFKIKIGRGFKWMPTEKGFERDKQVVSLIRKHAGPEAVLGVDANNGYDLARSKRFLTETPGAELAFVEELFPEKVPQNRELKDFLKENKYKTLVADGETQQTLEPFKPFMEAGVIDIYQGDMNHFGVEGIMTEAAWAAEHKLQVAPHNWGSLLGFYQIVQLGAALPNLYYAENDPLTNDVLLADGYKVQKGIVSVPDAPGFGLEVNEAVFAARIKPQLDLKA